MRRLPVLLFANNGLGAGHLARTLAIARALRRKAKDIELLLVTTSDADALIASQSIAAVRFPQPVLARESGWSDATRRAVAERVARAAIEGFRPQLLVADTFPSGPHGELSGLVGDVPRRALLRRTVRGGLSHDVPLVAGLTDYQLAIVADDPDKQPGRGLPIPTVHVPPITLFEADEGLPRSLARERLGLPGDGQFILVSAGGGGDADAVAIALSIAQSLAKLRDAPRPVLAVGPLTRAMAHDAGVLSVVESPLQPLLSAFDGAFVAAGYNTPHELAKAGIPVGLFAMPRPYDDQAARAARFEAAGLGVVLRGVDDVTIAAALAFMTAPPRRTIPAGGADRAAEALLELAHKGGR